MPEECLNFDVLHPQPLFIVISGPSGVGKDAVVKTLKERQTPFHFVVTATSRAPRPGEVHGVDYIFVSREEFERMIRDDELLEHANVYDQYKGVPKEQVRQAMASGKDVVMRLDVQGAASIKDMCPEAVLIFLIPRSYQEWLDMFQSRQTETEEQFNKRVADARWEMEKASLFDYTVVNARGCLDTTVSLIQAIIDVEHHRTHPRKITL